MIIKIKLLLVLLLISFTTFSRNADNVAQDNVTLKIILRPIQTITINPAQKDVKLIYDTKDKYANGVSREYVNHIEVFSTGGFIIEVKGGGNLLNDGKLIPLSDVYIKASDGDKVTGKPTYNNINLSTTGKTLISSKSGGRELKYNVTYDNSLGAGDRYINKYFNPVNSESVYTTTLTYTIISL